MIISSGPPPSSDQVPPFQALIDYYVLYLYYTLPISVVLGQPIQWTISLWRSTMHEHINNKLQIIFFSSILHLIEISSSRKGLAIQPQLCLHGNQLPFILLGWMLQLQVHTTEDSGPYGGHSPITLYWTCIT